MALEVLTKVYKPLYAVGQLYAKVYGSAAQPLPIGNVLELTLDHTESVEQQDNMTQLGGGVHSEVRRVTDIKVKMKIADVNVVNLGRAVLGTVSGVAAGTVTDEPFTLSALGSLLPLANIGATSVTLKKGATAVAATVVAATNYEVRPEGIWVPTGVSGLAPADKLWVSYSYGDQAVIEALTTKAAELQLLFGGLNEADSGNPVVVDIWRASQGVTKQLALLKKGFGGLDVEGTVLQDSTKTGVGVSKYYRARMV